ncbi:AraC family transcriptional regulator [Paenibacillus agaridevorans]|uniref:AraC family transcriptional regulator n=1 Tax=Paenibacillus agaridevorans TaxID=171404 RepID=A0A2R5ETJ6_9BACL|nr:AraC family transcriptional regulator [Paenibacillus agaridevorans]GBG09867.1 AraC family transcriptional regulator [Paenibacillus agaridevorans]
MTSSFRMPALSGHTFWKSKSQFLLDVDTYEDWALFLVEHGSFRYLVGESSGVASGGDWILCAPNTPFQREALTTLDFHFITFALEPSYDVQSEPPLPSGRYRPEETPRLRDTLNQLRAGIHAIHPAYAQTLRQHWINELWLHLYASVHETSTGLMRQTADPLMSRASERIREQANSPFTLKELAAELGLTPVQFTRRFRAAYGLNPLQFATDIRMRIAKKLLAETNLTLDAIAERCGYENGFYLSRIFRKQTQTTPSEYRKESLKARPILL